MKSLNYVPKVTQLINNETRIQTLKSSIKESQLLANCNYTILCCLPYIRTKCFLLVFKSTEFKEKKGKRNESRTPITSLCKLFTVF